VHWLPIHQRTITASTRSQYRRLIETHVVPALGAMKLQDVKPTHINALYTDLLKSGRRDHGRTASNGDGPSPTTVVKVHALLHKAFDAAVKWGLIARNPIVAANPPKAKGKGSKLNVWTDEQAAQFLDDLDEHDDDYTAPLRLALTTGLRRGELLGLAWGDVDLQGLKLVVRAQLNVIDGKMVYSEDTKSHRVRTVDIDSETAATLRRYHVRQEAQRRWTPGYRDAQFKRSDGSDVRLVFRHADGAPINPHPFSMAFKRRAKRAGVPVIRLHDLRHTHISKLVREGRLKVAQERAGHANAAFTMQVYASALPTEQAAAAQDAANDIDAMRKRGAS
jgi:integrase